MKTRPVGKTNLRVSEISLGCWTLGGKNWAQGGGERAGGQSIGWADVDPAEAAQGVHRAIELGVNHFDNADIYGNGHAERFLAQSLGDKSPHVHIATKVGHFWGTARHCYEPQHIRHQCEQSLVNLNRDVIDIYYFHHGDFGPNEVYLDDAVAMMHTLREEGKIRAIGLSAYSNERFQTLVPRIQPDILQGHCNILHDEFIHPEKAVSRLCKERGITFVTFGPLSQGVLLGKYNSANPPSFEDGDHRKNAERFSAAYLARVEGPLAEVKARFGATIPELARVALQYNLAHETVACTIPGFRNVSQVETNLAHTDKPLTEEEVSLIRGWFAGFNG
jgi:aryl-alcohol dehydrogenase-like predicted oxidoreductase